MSQFFRSRRNLALVVIPALAVPTVWLMARTRAPADDGVTAPVKHGEFEVAVNSTGELRAPKFVKITGPANAQQADQYSFKITWLAPEGTIVKEGDRVAELDRSTIGAKYSDVDLALQKAQAEYESASLDSALNLSKARSDMHTAAITVEEKQLAKDQSAYEAPSVKRQAELDYEQAVRALKQDSLDLKTKTDQAIAKMKEVGSDLTRQQNKLQVVKDVMAGYTVMAPAAGMLIYVREWDGKKQGIGSQVGTWDPTIATLPDFTQMESLTYVNEVDVRKVAVGQPVTVTLDADPTRQLHGKVTEVGNAGEQRPNSDAKVFEVVVSIEKPDTTLRPGMTTGNVIQTLALPNVLHVPIEAVMTENGIPFVYRRSGSSVTKQEVETGAANDDEIIVKRGLTADDRVYLSPPRDHDKLALVRLPGSKAGMRGDTGIGQPIPRPAPDSGAAPGPSRPAAPAKQG